MESPDKYFSSLHYMLSRNCSHRRCLDDSVGQTENDLERGTLNARFTCWKVLELGYLKDSNAAAHSVDTDIS